VRSLTIYALVLTTWLVLTANAWFGHGLFAWATGLAYILYDTCLLFYVAKKTLYVLDAKMTGIDAGAGPPPSAEPPRLGILIAAYNEARVLPRTLDALLPTLEGGDVVLVIDDGSSDDTLSVMAERFAVSWAEANPLGTSIANPALKILRVPHGGKARALNAGLLCLRTEVVVTVDADTRLAAGAIQALRREFAVDQSMVAACCVIQPICERGRLSAFFQWFQTYEYIRAFCSRIAWMRTGALLLVSGAFAGFRREALLAVGGFDPACLVEDYELIHRLHRHSYDHRLAWRVSVLPAPRALTDAPASVPSFLRQRRRWFAGFLQTQYWNWDMTFNARYGPLGSWMLPIKALDTMQPVFGLSALLLLIAFAVLGRLNVVVPVLCVIGAKIAIDLFFHVWWVHIYSRWTGQPAARGGWAYALLAALAEPFSFQVLRHLGATWGWCSFMAGRYRWGHSRTG
jgi:cellulose synthase/poly-beta-1,6-N-acetylglucosamine synthase-like glycosyltransferase